MGAPNFFSDVEKYFYEAESSLIDSEAENNLMLALIRGMVDLPSTKPEDLLLIEAECDGKKTFAIQMPPRALILSTGWSAEGLLGLADALRLKVPRLPGVVGPCVSASSFAKFWKADPELVMDQGIYRLDQLENRPSIAGEMIVAQDEDWALIRSWAQEFFVESLAREKLTVDEFLRWIERRFKEGAYRIWFMDGEPSGWAGTSGQTKNGIRIGPVYTPPRFRRQGIASALTWELSHELLRSGKKFCFLYTDLLNGTSNSIYQKIGYRMILQSQHWSF